MCVCVSMRASMCVCMLYLYVHACTVCLCKCAYMFPVCESLSHVSVHAMPVCTLCLYPCIFASMDTHACVHACFCTGPYACVDTHECGDASACVCKPCLYSYVCMRVQVFTPAPMCVACRSTPMCSHVCKHGVACACAHGMFSSTFGHLAGVHPPDAPGSSSQAYKSAPRLVVQKHARQEWCCL